MISCIDVAQKVVKGRSLIARSGCLFISICLAYENDYATEDQIIVRIADIWNKYHQLLTKNSRNEPIRMNSVVAGKIREYYNCTAKGKIMGFYYGKKFNSTHFVLVRDNKVYDTGIRSSMKNLTMEQWYYLNGLFKGPIKIYTLREQPYSL